MSDKEVKIVYYPNQPPVEAASVLKPAKSIISKSKKAIEKARDIRGDQARKALKPIEKVSGLNYLRIQAGMTEAQVSYLLGGPGTTTDSYNEGGYGIKLVQWTQNYNPNGIVQVLFSNVDLGPGRPLVVTEKGQKNLT